MKDDSLYNSGMLPLVHSDREMAASGLGWHREGEQVAYYRCGSDLDLDPDPTLTRQVSTIGSFCVICRNSIRRGRKSKRYSTLTFTLTTRHDLDLVHVAHCYPYTYTDLQR